MYNKISAFLFYPLMAIEIFIIYSMGLIYSGLLSSVKIFAISHLALAAVFFILIQILPFVSAPALTVKGESFDILGFIRKWHKPIIIIFINFFLILLYKSVDGFKSVVPIFFIVINVVITFIIITWKRLRQNIGFAYDIAVMAKKDPKATAKYLVTNPDVLDILIEMLPAGIIAQFAIGELKDKALELHKKSNVTDKDIEEMLPNVEKLKDLQK